MTCLFPRPRFALRVLAACPLLLEDALPSNMPATHFHGSSRGVSPREAWDQSTPLLQQLGSCIPSASSFPSCRSMSELWMICRAVMAFRATHLHQDGAAGCNFPASDCLRGSQCQSFFNMGQNLTERCLPFTGYPLEARGAGVVHSGAFPARSGAATSLQALEFPRIPRTPQLRMFSRMLSHALAQGYLGACKQRRKAPEQSSWTFQLSVA